MDSKIEQDIKKEFQVERLIFFTDAVFAISITLLVIDLRLPSVDQILSPAGFRNLFWKNGDRYISFVISFFMIGVFWVDHYRQFKYVKETRSGLIWLNLVYLFFVVLVPFTTSVWGDFSYLKLPATLYCFDIALIGILHWRMWHYLLNPKRNLVTGLDDKQMHWYYLVTTLVNPGVFLFTWLLFMLTGSGEAYFAFFLNFPVRMIAERYSRPKRLKIPPATRHSSRI